MSGRDGQCAACCHAEAREINHALVRGVPIAEVAETFSVGYGVVARHAREHVPKVLALAHNQLELANADALAATFNDLYAKARELLARCEAESDTRGAIVALRELVGIVDVGSRVAQTVAAATRKFSDQVKIVVVYADEELLREYQELRERGVARDEARRIVADKMIDRVIPPEGGRRETVQ